MQVLKWCCFFAAEISREAKLFIWRVCCVCWQPSKKNNKEMLSIISLLALSQMLRCVFNWVSFLCLRHTRLLSNRYLALSKKQNIEVLIYYILERKLFLKLLKEMMRQQWNSKVMQLQQCSKIVLALAILDYKLTTSILCLRRSAMDLA